jgi:hypothetical protein
VLPARACGSKIRRTLAGYPVRLRQHFTSILKGVKEESFPSRPCCNPLGGARVRVRRTAGRCGSSSRRGGPVLPSYTSTWPEPTPEATILLALPFEYAVRHVGNPYNIAQHAIYRYRLHSVHGCHLRNRWLRVKWRYNCDLSGKMLGPYAMQSPLGASGMGEVYRAHDSRLARTVAIKVLPSF